MFFLGGHTSSSAPFRAHRSLCLLRFKEKLTVQTGPGHCPESVSLSLFPSLNQRLRGFRFQAFFYDCDRLLTLSKMALCGSCRRLQGKPLQHRCWTIAKQRILVFSTMFYLDHSVPHCVACTMFIGNLLPVQFF